MLRALLVVGAPVDATRVHVLSVISQVLHSKLSIVDLAGSERLKKTMEGGVDGGAPIGNTRVFLTRLKETTLFNNK